MYPKPLADTKKYPHLPDRFSRSYCKNCNHQRYNHKYSFNCSKCGCKKFVSQVVNA